MAELILADLDAAQRTAAFHCLADMRALKKILEYARANPDLAQAADDAWDLAHVFFPDEFTNPRARLQVKAVQNHLRNRLKEYGLLDRVKPKATQYEQVDEPEDQPADQLRCDFCGKIMHSTSGKTLHQKVCKKRPKENR